LWDGNPLVGIYNRGAKISSGVKITPSGRGSFMVQGHGSQTKKPKSLGVKKTVFRI
jgi:hypothetical protein